ncbi:MAG: MFS transporter [Acidimicrobiia bacterium]|nr:MFS transporter [Acidimicrobiia bacterium]
MTTSDQPQLAERLTRADTVHRRRWTILAVLCLAVFVTVVDGTIVNVALPSLAVELGASTRQLQWIVDAYLLVFTGLLLAAGGLGDRFGRKRALVAGLVLFGITSAFAGSASSANELIWGRALMGVGAALIFPATLAILTNVFTDPGERAKAIGAWSAVTGLAVAAGPITGGWLLDQFWWGSVFYINVPVTIVAVLAAVAFVPDSKEHDAPALDLVGLVLSITSITALVLTIIEAPEWGWLSGRTFAGFIVAGGLVTTFVRWELRATHPMLPVRIFRNLRFSAASVAITSAFFALFGFIFLVTQYFQLVQGYTPLESGVRTLPVALSIAISSLMAPRVVERAGTTRVVMAGLTLMAIAFAWISANSATTSYSEIIGQMILLGGGLGFTTAPATESIMGSLSKDKAGVGSAVNDTTRELGGTLGVAVIGSVFSSVYADALADGPVFGQLPVEAQTLTAESVGAAQIVANDLGTTAPGYLVEVSDAFMSGFGTASLVVAFVAGAGALFAAKFLPAQAADTADDAGELTLYVPAALVPDPLELEAKTLETTHV